LIRQGKADEAFDVIVEGYKRDYPAGRFNGVPRILRDDVGLIGAAWIRQQPEKRAAITDRITQAGATLPTEPSLRFVLNWETDANDVDFHIHDGEGHHAFFSQMQLPTGGRLYADVTTGYGPECFAIDGAPAAGPYQLSLEYFSQGPMGYGMGLVEIERFDPAHGFSFDDRPYVIMTDHARIDLGAYAP
jgi:hypothetical protein